MTAWYRAQIACDYMPSGGVVALCLSFAFVVMIFLGYLIYVYHYKKPRPKEKMDTENDDDVNEHDLVDYRDYDNVNANFHGKNSLKHKSFPNISYDEELDVDNLHPTNQTPGANGYDKHIILAEKNAKKVTPEDLVHEAYVDDIAEDEERLVLMGSEHLGSNETGTIDGSGISFPSGTIVQRDRSPASSDAGNPEESTWT
jgi:hypothetical protein